MKMPFGMHKGKALANVPKPYLEWFVYGAKDIDINLLDGVKAQLGFWKESSLLVLSAKKAELKTLPQFQPTPATQEDIDGVLLADAMNRAAFDLFHADAIFTDGGIAGRNPSKVGGSWAWRAIDDRGGLVENNSGVLVPCADVRELKTITNNHTELYAAIDALAMLPSGWSGKIVSDSSCTIKRLQTRKPMMTNTPQLWTERMKAHLARLDKLSFMLVAGHPTPSDLDRGYNSKGVPVSEHNVAVDEECTRLVSELMGEES